MLSLNAPRRRMLVLLLSLSTLVASTALAEMPTDINFNGDIDAGRLVANDRDKGNCVACHMMAGSDSPGAIGPVLIAMQTRFPSEQVLAQQIWDATAKNPQAVMPPFGKHEILTDQEFADVVAFIWSL